MHDSAMAERWPRTTGSETGFLAFASLSAMFLPLMYCDELATTKSRMRSSVRELRIFLRWTMSRSTMESKIDSSMISRCCGSRCEKISGNPPQTR